MTKKESAQLIVAQKGACSGVFCSECPIEDEDCDSESFSEECPVRLNLAKEYLSSLEPEEPTKTETQEEHPSSRELKSRTGRSVTRNYGPQKLGADFSPTERELLDVYETEREFLSLELLWDIRELLKRSLDQSYYVEQAINNAGR